MLSGGVSCTGQALGSRCSSRSPLTRQQTRTRVSQKSRRCRIRKLPSQRRETPINSGRRTRARLSASCRSKRRHGRGQRKKEEKEKEKKAKEDERANRKRKDEEDKLATAAAGASPSQKKRAVEGLQATLQRGVRVGLSKSNGRATASDWRPHIPLDHDCRWTIPDIQPQTQPCYCAGFVSA